MNKKKMLLEIVIVVACLQGCSTWHRMTNSEKGMAIGGASGAGAGAEIGGMPGAVIGGAAGVVGGAVVGNEMDEEQYHRRNGY